MLSKEQIDMLDELAESVKGWSNCDSAWLDNAEDDPAAVVGHIDRDGNTYQVATIDCDQYMQGGDSIKLAKFYATANPQAVRELIAMLRESESKANAAVKALAKMVMECYPVTEDQAIASVEKSLCLDRYGARHAGAGE